MTTTSELDGQLTGENRSIQIDGDSFVYRQFGDANTDAQPLIGLQR